MYRLLPRASLLFLLWFSLLAACTSLIGPYSPTAYQNATSLKAQTLALMDKATEPYDAHRQEVEQVFVEAGKAYEYVKGVPSNGLSARQWSILMRRDGDLMGRFFGRWATQGHLSATYIGEFKGIVSDAFDEIICLEANKKEATACGVKEATS